VVLRYFDKTHVDRQVVLRGLHVGSERRCFLPRALRVRLHHGERTARWITGNYDWIKKESDVYHYAGDDLRVRRLLLQCVELGNTLLFCEDSFLIFTPKFLQLALLGKPFVVSIHI